VLFCGATCTPIPAVPLLANPPVQINATIPASLLTTPGVYAVRVFNPPPGGGLSFDQPFTVRVPAPPPPGYTVSVLPVPTVAGHPEHVTLVAPGVAAVTLQDRVQLVSLAGKSLIDAPIGVPSTAGFLGDIDADPARGIFVVTDPAGDTASVVEVNFGDPAASVITTVPVGYFPFGVAVNPTTNQAVVTNVGDLTLSVIDLGTKQLVRTIPLAGATNPTYVAVNPSTNLAVVVDQDFVGASSAILVDVASGQVLRTLRVGVGATLPAVDPGLDEALVANSLDDSLALIDLGRRRVDRTIPVGQLPQGVAIDAGAHRAMVADTTSNDILFVDLQTFALGDVVKLGSGGAEAPFDLAWDVAGKVAIATSAAVGPVTRNNLILIDLPR
ncbi:MAG TPA: YncE family protein, partial [Methylomirabilota bacterium]|nr:YncE family protein [Methylomirabilota bacterium]